MNSIYDNLVPFSKNPHYLSRYIKFISRCQSRVLDARVYIEKHHIHPTSLGGDNSSENLIVLTAREHFIVHWILWKAIGGKMTYAFMRMQNDRTRMKSSRVYSSLKEQMSESYKGKGNPMYGVSLKCSDEKREKHRIASTGKLHSKEAKEKISKALKGKSTFNKGRIAISNPETLELRYVERDLPIPEGWIIGSMKKTSNDRIGISHLHSMEMKYIKKDEEIPEGWVKGFLYSEMRNLWINNPETGKCKRIRSSDTIPEGYILGRGNKWDNKMKKSL